MQSDSVTAGYFPEWMVIRLPESYTWMFLENGHGPASPADRARSLAIFFHEWIHHFHNTSTISGILAFSATMSLWSSFRWTVSAFGSGGSDSADLPEAHHVHIERMSKYFNAVRKRRECNEKLKAFNKGFAFYNDENAIVAEPIAKLPKWADGMATEVFHVLRCHARRLRGGSYSNIENVVVEIGTFEIVEGVASLLETLLVRCICPGENPEAMPFSPYELLPRFAEHIVPDINDELIVACAIASLQHPDPPTELLRILRELAPIDGKDREKFVESIAMDLVRRNRNNIELHLRYLDRRFPVDEPMAEVVKWLTVRMRARLDEREATAFPELQLLTKIAFDPTKILEALVDRSSALLFLMSTQGIAGNDSAHLLELRPPYTGRSESAFQAGRFRFWTALHFLNQHLGEENIINSKSVESSTASSVCPLYCHCDYPPRLRNEPSCKEAPWRIGESKLAQEEICWYHAGEIASRRGPIEDSCER